jgi:hypothetical protein
MIAVRIFVIATKYGYFSWEHDKILKNVYIDANLN